MSHALLEVRNMVKRFGGLTAVDHVSFEVMPGRIIGVIGPNGSGKTTLFANVSGFQTPEEGEIRFDGRLITGMRPSVLCELGMPEPFKLFNHSQD